MAIFTIAATALLSTIGVTGTFAIASLATPTVGKSYIEFRSSDLEMNK